MDSTVTGRLRSIRGAAAVGVLVLVLAFAPAPAAAQTPRARDARPVDAPVLDAVDARAIWAWPTRSHQVVNPYVAPANRYGPGHRGIDLAAPVGSAVTAPADGVVAFVGSVAGRPLLTIDHGGGLVSTLEPAASDAAAGQAVRRGEEVGVVASGGHAVEGTVHLGARRDGEYINPLLLLGGIPRAVLLPCCL